MARKLALIALLAIGLAVAAAPAARADGNASAAAGFIESAQNSDGGFGAKQGAASDPTATAWASLALLAAGKNPRDEFLKNGRSADDYLAANKGSLTSLEQLGLLAMVQYGGEFGAGHYGDPVAKITSQLSAEAVRQDPFGASLASFGLLAAGTPEARQLADATAQALLEIRTSDGAWGPSGNADSVSTALALQLLAATGAAGSGDAVVRDGVDYLAAAQANDGAIAASTRIASAGGGGSVPATAFTLQALAALGLPSPHTDTGKTVRYGLTQYQQRTSGGLTSRGSIYSPVPPSVTESAQAFTAFNGDTLPVDPVASVTSGSEGKKKGTDASKAAGEGKDTSSTRVSSGSSSEGVSATAGGTQKADPGAFEQAKAESAGSTSGKDASSERDRKGEEGKRGDEAGGGTEISGTVVGTESAPSLKSKAGALDDGLSNQQKAMLGLVALLVALGGAGVFLERMRPRPADAPPLAYAAAGAVARPTAKGLRRAAGLTARDAATGAPLTSRTRWPLLVVGSVGFVLVFFPLVTGMFDKAPKGAAMVAAFRPYMQEQRLAEYQEEFGQVRDYANELRDDAPAVLLPGVSDPVQRRRAFLERSPAAALFLQQWPGVDRTLGGMLGTIQANQGNYDAVAALPSFRLFPWFFVIPGALLAVLALAGLAFGRRNPRSWVPIRRAAIAIGVGLVLAPVVFNMFERAPRGASMVSAFKTVETRSLVQEVQSGFGTIAIGQGSINGELYPALEDEGMSAKEVAKRLPAAATFNEHWTETLNDLTPMIGVMSDNVVNYRAVLAMPPFGLFPWLFVLAGLAALAFALLAGRVPAATQRRESNPTPAEDDVPSSSVPPNSPTASAIEPVALVATKR
ncbi:MAG: prenyltransferase/squalene oxidase repeat-containing protein [Solirubrobacterales bacterium]